MDMSPIRQNPKKFPFKYQKRRHGILDAVFLIKKIENGMSRRPEAVNKMLVKIIKIVLSTILVLACAFVAVHVACGSWLEINMQKIFGARDVRENIGKIAFKDNWLTRGILRNPNEFVTYLFRFIPYTYSPKDTVANEEFKTIYSIEVYENCREYRAIIVSGSTDEEIRDYRKHYLRLSRRRGHGKGKDMAIRVLGCKAFLYTQNEESNYSTIYVIDLGIEILMPHANILREIKFIESLIESECVPKR